MITITIMQTLAVNHFEEQPSGILWWGHGTLVWGDVIKVKDLGNDLYEVTTEHWYYNCDMDPVVDTHKVQTMHGAQVLEVAFSDFPLWRYRH
jgi:hypothetical protein